MHALLPTLTTTGPAVGMGELIRESFPNLGRAQPEGLWAQPSLMIHLTGKCVLMIGEQTADPSERPEPSGAQCRRPYLLLALLEEFGSFGERAHDWGG